jgi:hypothetical protein
MVPESRSLDSLSSDAVGLVARKLARTRSDPHGARIAEADLEHWHPEERAVPIHGETAVICGPGEVRRVLHNAVTRPSHGGPHHMV